MRKVTAVLSMLHEHAGAPNAATRRFRNEPVLAWTLKRLAKAKRLTDTAIVCWEDQLAGVEPIAAEREAYVSIRSPRLPLAQIEAVAAARRWADGWRGGLVGSCDFDRGFYGPWVQEVRLRTQADAVLLVDPSAALVDALMIDDLLLHAERHPKIELCFTQAAPGLCGVLLLPALLDQLAATRLHPGALIAYRPDMARRDPIATESCATIPAPLARTLHRFTLDSERQVARISIATKALNGQLMGTPAQGLLAALDSAAMSDRLPREVVLELNTVRASRPIFAAGSRLDLNRGELPLALVQTLFDELAEMDDIRVTLGGQGDPLLRSDLPQIIEMAGSSGIHSLAIETDFLNVDAARIGELAESNVDVVSVYLPAVTPATYQAVMGVDGYDTVLAMIRRFVESRQARARGVPLLAPIFVKCKANLGEMEAWYDSWLRALNCAVIQGPSSFSGLIPDVSVANMEPPRRRPCHRLTSRLTILSDGTIVTCEQDVLGRQALGRLGENTARQAVRQAWAQAAAVRSDHQAGRWDKHVACAGCRDWHRA